MKFLKFGLILLPLITTGCSATIHLEPAPKSNAVSCADLMVRLPDTLDGLVRRSTDAQSTAAYGEPAAVLFRCGLPEAQVSTLRCLTEQGVDWLVDPSKDPSFRFITFGRNPATEVIVDSRHAVGVNVLDQIAPTILSQPASRRCG